MYARCAMACSEMSWTVKLSARFKQHHRMDYPVAKAQVPRKPAARIERVRIEE